MTKRKSFYVACPTGEEGFSTWKMFPDCYLPKQPRWKIRKLTSYHLL